MLDFNSTLPLLAHAGLSDPPYLTGWDLLLIFVLSPVGMIISVLLLIFFGVSVNLLVRFAMDITRNASRISRTAMQQREDAFLAKIDESASQLVIPPAEDPRR